MKNKIKIFSIQILTILLILTPSFAAKDFVVANKTTGKYLFVVNGTTGYVGIGKINPLYPLDVVGTARISGDLILSSFTNCGKLYTDANGYVKCGTETAAVTGSGTVGYIPIWTGTSQLGDSLINQTNGNVWITSGSLNLVSGSLEIGGTNVITSGRVLTNIASVSGNLIPSSSNTYDLGSSSNRWKNIYGNSLDIYTSYTYPAKLIISSDHLSLQGLYGGSNNLPYFEIRDENGTRAFFLGWGSKSGKRVDWVFENDYQPYVKSNWLPYSNNAYNLGSSSLQWANIYGVNIYQNNNQVLDTSTNFGNSASSDITVSGNYNSLNLQLKAGVVGTNELADNSVTSAKIADHTIQAVDLVSDLGLGWKNLTDYPASCGPGKAVQAIGDTLTCIDISENSNITGVGNDNALAYWKSSSSLDALDYGNSGQFLKSQGNGNLPVWDAIDLGVDTNGNYVASVSGGNGISVSGTPGEGWTPTISAKIGTGLAFDGSGNIYVKYGSTAGTAVEGNKQITISAGSGLSGGGTITLGNGGSVTISHGDTSSQGSVDNSGGTVIQDISLDEYGHVTGIGSVNLDNRYYTESEADTRFANVDQDETISGKWTFNEDVKFMKNIYVAGNISYVNSQTLNVNGSIIPPLDNWFDIGNSSNRWRQVNAITLNSEDITLRDSSWTTRFHLDLDEINDRIVFRSPYGWKFQFNQNILPGSDDSFDIGSSTLRFKNGYFSGIVYASAFEGSISANNVEDIWVNESGDVMTGKLTISSGGLEVSGNTTLHDDLNVDSGTLYVDSVGDKVGIGSTSPAYKLDVNGDIQGSSIHVLNTLYIYGNAAQGRLQIGGGYRWIGLKTRNSQYSYLIGDDLQENFEISIYNHTSGSYSWSVFEIEPGAQSNSLHIDSSGNIGIGSTSPAYKLDVSGSGRFTGDLHVEGTIYGDIQGSITATGDLNMNEHSIYNAQDVNASRFFQNGKQVIDTISAGNGISVSRSGGSVTISHGDTSSQGSVDNSGLTFIQNITLDNYGHVTGLASATINAGNGLTSSGTTLNVGAGNCISVGADSVGVASDCIDDTEIADSYKTVSVQNSAGTEQFGITDGNKALQFAAGNGITINFDSANHRVTISDSNAGSEVTTSGGTANYVAKFTGSNTIGNSIIYDNGNSVGIGTSSPASGYKLDVQGEVQMGANNDIFTSTASNILGGGSSSGRLNADSFHTNGLGYGQIYIEGSRIDANTVIYIGKGQAGGMSAQDVVLGNNNEVYVDTSTNRVGIKTSTPSYDLDVNGKGYFSSDLYTDGYVGIGTTSPSSKLDVSGGNIEINNGAATGTYKVKGHRQLYVGDETEVRTNHNSYVLVKQFTAVFDSNYGIKPSYINVIAQLKNSGGYTTYFNVTIEGCGGIELTTTSTSYTLVKGTINTASCSDGTHVVSMYLKTSNTNGYAYNKLIEFYYVE